MQHFYNTQRYEHLAALLREGATVEAGKWIEQAIAETEGRELAFWYVIRTGRQLDLPVPNVNQIMADIYAALAMAPDDPETEEGVSLALLSLAVRTERLEEPARWIAYLRRVRRTSPEPFLIDFNLGVIQWRRMRPAAAVRHFTRALNGMGAWPEERMQYNRGRYFSGHCYRALTLLETGHLAEAERDVETAVALFDSIRNVQVTDLFLILARASLALHKGELQEARRHLQMVHAGGKHSRYYSASYPLRIEVDLVAARIAQAEGNAAAFDHFWGRALATAHEQDLVVTARRLLAVREGGSRRVKAPR